MFVACAPTAPMGLPAGHLGSGPEQEPVGTGARAADGKRHRGEGGCSL